MIDCRTSLHLQIEPCAVRGVAGVSGGTWIEIDQALVVHFDSVDQVEGFIDQLRSAAHEAVG